MMIKVLKAVPASGMTRNDFPWPESGQVECPDWIPHNECGNGLHAWIWEESLTPEGCTLEEGMTFRVVEIDDSKENMVRLEGKIKFHRGDVVGSYSSIQEAVTAQGLQSKPDRAGFCGTATAGDRGTATAGYYGTATAGDSGTATAGDSGTATAGDRGTATAGHGGTATAGYYGTATAGDRGTATVGYEGTATAGDRGTATAGYYGTATAGYGGTATAGDSGTATAGYGGTATAGERGTATAGEGGTATAGYIGKVKGGKNAVLSLFGYKNEVYRPFITVVGEDGIEPNMFYQLSENNKFVKVEEEK